MIVGEAFFIPSYIAMTAICGTATAAAVAVMRAIAIGLLFARKLKQHHQNYYA